MAESITERILLSKELIGAVQSCVDVGMRPKRIRALVRLMIEVCKSLKDVGDCDLAEWLERVAEAQWGESERRRVQRE